MQLSHVHDLNQRAGVGDGTVALWDVRKLSQGAKPVATAGHNYSCQAAFFAPDGGPLDLLHLMFRVAISCLT